MFFDVMPLRAISFQFLLLMIAIALEAVVFYRILELDHKTSVQYAMTVNLLSTLIGWIIFFIFQPWLPQEWKIQLISYVFFERFFSDTLMTGIASVLVMVCLSMFIGTFIIKLKGLEILEHLLDGSEKKPTTSAGKPEKSKRVRDRRNQSIGFQVHSRSYAVLLANSCSFSAILLVLLIRQSMQ
jgi:hypothetical protein